MLESYAITEENSQGREYKTLHSSEDKRNEFERDFSRVMNSTYARQLRQKTQVFASDIGNDFFRSRLDHSMEVAGIAKSIATSLNINPDLASVLGLSHDLGHAPFGHLGQDVLNDLMKGHGGFEHNIQSLRIVDELEISYYPQHVGLNLMYESREGLLKHCSKENAIKLGAIARRHLTGKQSFLEAQVVDLADAISYLHADLEDAFHFKLLTPEHFEEIPNFIESFNKLHKEMPNIYDKLPTLDEFMNPKTAKQLQTVRGIVRSTIKTMLSTSINNVIKNSKENIYSYSIKTVDDVKNHPKELIVFSDSQYLAHKTLKKFSREKIYNNPFVLNERKMHKDVLTTIFNYYKDNPKLLELNGLPRENVPLNEKENDFYRKLCDYVSGMTDRYANQQYQEIIQYGKVLEREERFQERLKSKQFNNKSKTYNI